MSIIVDPTKTQFSTTYEVDKIALYSTKEDGQGYTANGSIAVGPANSLPFAEIYYASIANPYGRKCLFTLSWSVDNINYYPQNVPLFYFNGSYNSYFWQALAFGGCSDELVYVAVTTQYTAAQTVYLQFALDSPT